MAGEVREVKACQAASGRVKFCTARRLEVSSRRSYLAVVVASACPASFWTVNTSTPASRRCDRRPTEVMRRESIYLGLLLTASEDVGDRLAP